MFEPPPPPPKPLRELLKTEVLVVLEVVLVAEMVPVITVCPSFKPEVITVSVSEEIPVSTSTIKIFITSLNYTPKLKKS